MACISSKHSFVYHQGATLYIIKSQRNTPSVMIYSPRGWWYPPHFVRWWYTKSATWIKKYCRKCILFCSIFWWSIADSTRGANLRKRCGASLMNLLRKYHTRSSAVADVHRKSALYRSSFESPFCTNYNKKSQSTHKGLIWLFCERAMKRIQNWKRMN